MIRRTLAKPTTIHGTGLFTDAPALATLSPAAAGTGLAFFHHNTRIDATIINLAPSPIDAFKHLPARHTCLSLDAARATTTEHLLAALRGLGITDATITLGDSGELPIGDGSAKLFTDAIADAGTADLDDEITPITLTEPITVTQGNASITASPATTTSYTYIYEPGDNTPLPRQTATWNTDTHDFAAHIAPARTFSFQHEAEQMQAMGLFTSFTPRDLLVLDTAGAPIDNTLRFDNEPARHKLLDLVGDLSLAGAPIVATITATGSGHSLNHELARKLAQLAR